MEQLLAIAKLFTCMSVRKDRPLRITLWYSKTHAQITPEHTAACGALPGCTHWYYFSSLLRQNTDLFCFSWRENSTHRSENKLHHLHTTGPEGVSQKHLPTERQSVGGPYVCTQSSSTSESIRLCWMRATWTEQSCSIQLDRNATLHSERSYEVSQLAK